MKLFKNVAVRITALLLFSAMIAAVILYEAGVYDISFIKRPLPEVTDENTETGTDETLPVPDTEETEGSNTSAGGTTEKDSETTQGNPDDEKLLDLIMSLAEMEKDGWKISCNPFGSNSSVARLEFDFGLSKNIFSSRTETVTQTVIYRKADGIYDTKEITYQKNIPSVQLYSGLIFLDSGENISVWNADGRKIIDSFKGEPAFAKSASGKPTVKIGDEYYEIDPEKGLSGKVSKESLKFHAIQFDAPEYYAKDSRSGPYPFCEYVDIYTEITTEPQDTEPEETSGDSSTETVPEDTESDTEADTEPDSTESESAEDTEPDSTESESAADTEPDSSGSEPAADTEPDSTESVQPSETSSDETSGYPDEESEKVSDIPVDVSEKINEAEPETDEREIVEIDGKLYYVETKLMWGYKDRKGRTVIKPKYKAAYDFTYEGLAAVVDFDNRMSFINRYGRTVITLNNREIIRYSDKQRTKVKQSYYEPASKGIENIGTYYFDRGYVMVRYVYRGIQSNRLFLNENRLLSKSGKYFDIPTGYSLVNYSDGVLLLEKNGQYGYMDLEGAWILPAVFISASPFIQGLASVTGPNGKKGLVDTDGNFVLPMYFDYISAPSKGLVCTYEKTRGFEIYCVVEK